MFRGWLGRVPKTDNTTAKGSKAEARRPQNLALVTERAPGAAIRTNGQPGSLFLHVEAGARVAILGDDVFKKHCFCDWVLGFSDLPGHQVELEVDGRVVDSAAERGSLGSVLGRSPLLVGETIQESMLYRTHGIRKQELFDAIEKFYGPSLRARTNPLNPLSDQNGKPIPTHLLSAREHVEIGQLIVWLQKTPLVIVDLSSQLMQEALAQGFKLNPALSESGKTLIMILPAGKDTTWAEEVTGCRVTANFDL